ncbi:MAG: hypothetical protein GEV03_09400 [Streptosporangiales bacterium]|nr:hypothetical protein [Streptosporangiales bacterium]
MATQPPPVEVRRRPTRAILAGFGAAGFAGVAGGFASFTWQATVCVMLGGAVIVLLGMLRPQRRRLAPTPRRGALAWAILAVGFLGWEGSALVTGSGPSHPSLSLLLDPVLEPHAVRSVAFLGWLLGGWMLVRR